MSAYEKGSFADYMNEGYGIDINKETKDMIFNIDQLCAAYHGGRSSLLIKIDRLEKDIQGLIDTPFE